MRETIKHTDLATQRQWYAEGLRVAAHFRSPRLVHAFATVPREAFLGSGPWSVLGPGGYGKTPDDHPKYVNHDVVVAIDPQRKLNNGQPSFLAYLINHLDVKQGDVIYHIGCGTGYYSAIMSQLVGPDGRVIAVEQDETLVRRSQFNLREYAQVEVIHADGFQYEPGRVDAILVNAGVTHLSPVWLDALRAKGRLVVPLTVNPEANVYRGYVLKTVRSGRVWRARFISSVSIFPCQSGREIGAEIRLQRALDVGGISEVKSLRRDQHIRGSTCWLHADGFCLSRVSSCPSSKPYPP